MRKTVSFRSQASGTLTDLLNDEGMKCSASQDLICHLAAELVDYREEGAELNPVILFCNSIEKITDGLPRSKMHHLGDCKLSAESVTRILKECAPLTSHNWIIFIERIDEFNARYGVLNFLQTPATPGLVEVISWAASSAALVIRRTARGTIEISGAKGHSRILVFSTLRDDTPEQPDLVGNFARDCCLKCPPGIPLEGFDVYFRGMLQRILERSHGTILVCDPSGTLHKMDGARDAIIFESSIDFAADFSEYRVSDSAESIMKIQRSEDLFQGLVNSDGIVILNGRGAVAGYRMFYTPPEPVADVVGGARRRAFEALRKLVGATITSALFRSQDGGMLYEGSEK